VGAGGVEAVAGEGVDLVDGRFFGRAVEVLIGTLVGVSVPTLGVLS